MPDSGGFLEAIPLTAFVCMCLHAGKMECKYVIDKGLFFLKNQQRPDGSFPIDSDLSTWVTTLSIKALGSDVKKILPIENIEKLKKHLHSIQFKQKHIFNQATPGGWGWTNATGSVPDVDDTSGAILALLELYNDKNEEETTAIINGCMWLTGLQNNDGGFPTFCKGWNRLPFDRSCSDLTGHALAAMILTINQLKDKVPSDVRSNLLKSISKALLFLTDDQHPDGYWYPLWFGNQMTPEKKNPVYGTAKVVTYLQDSLQKGSFLEETTKSIMSNMIDKGQKYLLKQQNPDGSWGGSIGIDGSMEETALTICALSKAHKDHCMNGLRWLQYHYNTRGLISKPIGLYFAALWYDEKLYPLVYYIEALRRFQINVCP